MNVRASSLPLLFSCASSHAPCKRPVNANDTDPQQIGRATHEACERYVLGTLPDDDAAVVEIARNYRVKPADVEPLLSYWRQCWDALPSEFHIGPHEAENEYKMLISPDLYLGGHPDIEGMTSGVDVKTGRIYHDASWQVQGYARLTGKRWWAIAWLRFGTYEIVEAMEPSVFDDALHQQIEQIGKQYAPGDECYFCPRQVECEARQEHLRNTHKLIVGGKGTLANRSDLARAYPMAKQLEDALAAYYQAVNADLAVNGPLPLGNGTEVYMHETHPRQIDPAKGWEPLCDALPDEYLAKCLTVSVTAVEEQVKVAVKADHNGKPPRGALGQAVAGIMRKLEEAGALTRRTQMARRTRKVEG